MNIEIKKLIDELYEIRKSYRYSNPGFSNPYEIAERAFRKIGELKSLTNIYYKKLDNTCKLICLTEHTASTDYFLKFIHLHKEILGAKYVELRKSEATNNAIVFKGQIFPSIDFKAEDFSDYELLLKISSINIEEHRQKRPGGKSEKLKRKNTAYGLLKSALENIRSREFTPNKNINSTRFENLEQATYLYHSLNNNLSNKIYLEVLNCLLSIRIDGIRLGETSKYKIITFRAILKSAISSKPDPSDISALSSDLKTNSLTRDSFADFDLNMNRMLDIIYNNIVSIIEHKNGYSEKDSFVLWRFLINNLDLDTQPLRGKDEKLCFALYKNGIYALVLKDGIYTYSISKDDLDSVRDNKESYEKFNSFIKDTDFFNKYTGREIAIYSIGESTKINLFGLLDAQNKSVLRNIRLINYSPAYKNHLPLNFDEFAVLYDSSLGNLQENIKSSKAEGETIITSTLSYDSQSDDADIEKIIKFINNSKNLIVIGHSSINHIESELTGLVINENKVKVIDFGSLAKNQPIGPLGTLIYLSCEGSAGNQYRINESIAKRAIDYGYSEVISSNRKLLLTEAIDLLHLVKEGNFPSSAELLTAAREISLDSKKTFPYMITI